MDKKAIVSTTAAVIAGGLFSAGVYMADKPTLDAASDLQDAIDKSNEIYKNNEDAGKSNSQTTSSETKK